MVITISFCNNRGPKIFDNECKSDVEEVIREIARELNVQPLYYVLYGLRNEKSLLWLCLSKQICDLQQNVSYQFRIRFQTCSTLLLKGKDYESYIYMFYQTRHDFLKGYLPPYIQQQKQDDLGLIVTDILHYLISNPGKSFGDIELKSFMPSNLNTFAYRSNVRRNIESIIEANNDYFKDRGPSFLRDEYLKTIEAHETGRLFEIYPLEVDEGLSCSHLKLHIDPFHPRFSGLFHQSKKVIKHVCTIEEIVFVSTRKQDLTIELSRENGSPYYYRVNSLEMLESLVGCVSGYYRLMKSWNFDLCRELSTPSLSNLKSQKCHGPVGIEFVLSKLKSKSSGQTGIGLLRQSATDYDVYKLVVTQKMDNFPVKLVIVKSKNGQFHFLGCDVKHDRLCELIQWAIETNYLDCGLIRLLPPSEFDHRSQLLLCASNKKKSLAKTLGPRILNIEMFVPKIGEAPLRGRFSVVYHCIWPEEGNEECAVKVPKFQASEKDNFLSMMNKYLFVEGDCIIKIFGLTLTPMSLVMEYLPLGPLDKYLQNNSDSIRKVDLVEASAHLAKALCDLNAKDVTHFNIRCHNILVSHHTDQRFKIKLADPGKAEYSNEDIHWIPREHLNHPSSALADPTVDIWAFGTTLWQIFSFGIVPLKSSQITEVKALYKEGQVLGKPDICPKELYQIMTSCWHKDPLARKHPQSLLRDIQQIFYDTFNSRRENPYQKVQYTAIDGGDSIDDGDGSSIMQDDDDISISTQITTLTQEDGSIMRVSMSQMMDYNLISPDFAMLQSIAPTSYSSPKSPTKMPKTLQDLLVPPPWNVQEQDIMDSEAQFELNNSTIDIVQRIGKGNYGYVFKGRMTFLDNRMEYVALKRLQSVVGNTNDFKKEMEIMKTLRHENIVTFHGLIESDQEGSSFQYMVMEYLSLGSLQEYLLNNSEKSLTSDQILLSFARDIAKGMDHLESKQIIHRDLAARNVLVESKDHVKITDFGLAQRPNQGNYYILRTNRELPIKWYALESIEHGKYSHKSDVWSYGVTLWEMFTRGLVPDLPNEGFKLIQALKNGTRLVCKAPCKAFIYSKLIRPCWDEDPKSRPDFSTLLETVSEIQDEI